MVEMMVDSVRVNLVSPSRVVVLKECDGARYLAIMIGTAEADAIAVKLQDRQVQRPLTHDLLRSLVDTVGAGVQHVSITKMVDQIYYANIAMTFNGRQLEVDCRPSDAIALAVRVSVPILVDEEVLGQAGFEADQEQEDTESTDGDAEPVSEEKLEVFRKFIDQLDLDDFGRS
ncbi:MAG: bifunctional nuclease family protein [Chloroflexi bacterium]|nr:bifunctional nuclease family protein [Chloroflexota bacterium]